MIQVGDLRPSLGNYASPLHVIKKTGTLERRPVGDYRTFNAKTVKDRYFIKAY